MNAPDGTSTVGTAVDWIQSALLGSAATAVAIVAVASIGFLMLTGRTEVRRAGQVVLGCFIIFGASTIAAGIQSFVSQAGVGGHVARSGRFARRAAATKGQETGR